MNKRLFRSIILVLILTIFSSKVYAYDINNPKLPSQRSYTFGQHVTLVDNTEWDVVIPVDSSSTSVNMVYGSYATLPSNNQVVMNHNYLVYNAIPEITNWFTTHLANAGGDTTGLVVANLDSATVQALVNYANSNSVSWAFLINANYWLTDSCPNGYWAINVNTGFICVAASDATTYGYKPYISTLKSNIRGKYQVTTSSSHGTITPSVTYYDQDEKIILTVTPDAGYKFNEGTLKYNDIVVETDNQGRFAYLGPSDNSTVTADFSRIKYNITYNYTKDVENTNKATYYVNTATFALTDLEKECYVFDGWYSDPNFSNQVTQVPKGSTGDKTFYAKWSRDPAKTPSYEVSIPSSLSLNSSNGTFDIAAGNLVNIGDGSVEVNLTYPTGGFSLNSNDSDSVPYKLYKGTSAVANKEITSSNTLVAEFTNSGTQSLYYDIDDVRYPGTYSGSLTFNIDFIDNLE